jgi:ABC-type Zn uptake system ZnuABC Zn-binding protein ZnuA
VPSPRISRGTFARFVVLFPSFGPLKRNIIEIAAIMPGVRRLLPPLVAMLLLALGACGAPKRDPRPSYLVTIPPLGAILREVVGDRATVTVLLPPGASPHTFEASPYDADAAERANALFSVYPTLDGRVSHLSSARQIRFFDLVGEEFRKFSDEGGFDPHFWTDPRAVKSILPSLVKDLTELDPAGAATYEAGAKRFSAELDALDAELTATLAPVKGQAAVLFHRSMAYMLSRYGLRVAAVVEPSPGKEPTARDLENVIDRARSQKARAVFTEPQLPRRPAEVLAESTGLRLGELDAEGGGAGRDSYADLMRYNAKELARCLKP